MDFRQLQNTPSLHLSVDFCLFHIGLEEEKGTQARNTSLRETFEKGMRG